MTTRFATSALLFPCIAITAPSDVGVCDLGVGDGIQNESSRRVDSQQQTARTPNRSVPTTGEDLRVLYVLLKLREDTADTDAKIVDALRRAAWFNRIMLVVPSWQDKPDAASHLLVHRALNICREQKIPVIWGRWLWVAWPRSDARVPHVPNRFDPAYYARAIATVKTEARSIGATETLLDAEPYAESVQKHTLKFAKLSPEEQSRIRGAVMIAVSNAGRVDFIRPTSSRRESHFAWALIDLGTLRCDCKPYYTKAPDYKLPKVMPPQQSEHRIDVWGCNVGLGRHEDVYRGRVKLTARDVKALDLSVIRRRHPQCRGLWVYIDYDIFADVIRAWNR